MVGNFGAAAQGVKRHLVERLIGNELQEPADIFRVEPASGMRSETLSKAWVATAPCPALACIARAPTARNLDAIPQPISPVDGSRTTMEKVIAAPLEAWLASDRTQY